MRCRSPSEALRRLAPRARYAGRPALRGRQPCLIGSNTSASVSWCGVGARRSPSPSFGASSAAPPASAAPLRRRASRAGPPRGAVPLIPPPVRAAGRLRGSPVGRGGGGGGASAAGGASCPPALGAFGAALFCCGRRLRPVASPNYPPALPSRWEGRGREASGHRCGGDGSLRRQSRRCAVKTAQKYAEAARLCAHVPLFLFGLRSAAGLPPLAAATKPAVPRYRPHRHLPVSVPAALPPSRCLYRPPGACFGRPPAVSAALRLYRPPSAQSNSPNATKRVFILLRSKKP